MTDRKTDRQIIQEYDECTNPVTRSVLKDVGMNRLRDAVNTIEELEARIEELESKLERSGNL